jgi:hypothetical protein
MIDAFQNAGRVAIETIEPVLTHYADPAPISPLQEDLEGMFDGNISAAFNMPVLREISGVADLFFGATHYMIGIAQNTLPTNIVPQHPAPEDHFERAQSLFDCSLAKLKTSPVLLSLVIGTAIVIAVSDRGQT